MTEQMEWNLPLQEHDNITSLPAYYQNILIEKCVPKLQNERHIKIKNRKMFSCITVGINMT